MLEEMRYKIVFKDDYCLNRSKYLGYIVELYKNDNDKLADMSEITRHLDFIFSCDEALLIMLFNDDELVSMVNAYQYNNVLNEWCIFSLFTKKSYRGNKMGFNTLKLIIDEIKKYNPNKIISGIESDNIVSIKLHEKLGFEYSNCSWDELAEGFPKGHLGFVYRNR